MEKQHGYHHGNLKNAAIDAGWKALRDRGAEALSLRDVASVTGVTHRSLYRHFRDKSALLDALAARGAVRLAEAMEAAGTEAADRLAAYVGFALAEPDVFRLVFSGNRLRAHSDPDLKAAYGRLIAAGQDTFRREGEDSRALRDGVIRYWAAAHGLADLLLSGMLGASSPEAGARYARDQLTRLIAEDTRRHDTKG